MMNPFPLVVALSLLAQPSTDSGAPAPEDQCIKCHADLPTTNLSSPAGTQDVHAQAKVGCIDCHGGNPAAKTALEGHANGFAAHPNDAVGVNAMCGKCHPEPSKNYQRSPHFTSQNAPRRATCVTCHGSHEVQRASLDIIGEPLCTSCHELAKPRRIWKALTDAENDLTALEALLAGKGINGEVSAQVKAARSELRGLSHAHNLIEITHKAAQALGMADEVRAKLAPRVQGAEFGRWVRWGGGIVGGLMGLGAVLWGGRWMRRRHQKATVTTKKRLRWLGLLAIPVLAVVGIGGAKTNAYIEHDPQFCTSCHVMNSAYQTWGASGHKEVECHACHLADLGSNLHQLWMYATQKPDNVIKHAFVNRKACENCHQSGSEKLKWSKIAETSGHRQHVEKERIECVQCHGLSVHRFKAPPELCKSCHTQITLAAAGSMEEMHCLECHPFMAAEAGRSLKPDRAACLECHAEMQVKKESFPKDAPMNWACGECHKPHRQIRIGQADCLECHEADLGKGIHAVKSHTECLSCHDPHVWKVSGRTGCEKCHKDRQAHNPEMDCADCHGAE